MAQFKKFAGADADGNIIWEDVTPEEEANIIAAIIETTPTA